MKTDVILLVLGMSLVTYIPRALPAFILDRLKLRAGVERFLNLIPYTAMAALIFPGVLNVDTSNPLIGILGGASALFLAWRRLPLVVCVLSAIGVDLILYLFM